MACVAVCKRSWFGIVCQQLAISLSTANLLAECRPEFTQVLDRVVQLEEELGCAST